MSAAQDYAIKSLLKLVGVDINIIIPKAIAAQAVVQEFDLEKLRLAIQTVLDYKQDQEQNQLRLIAIMNALQIVDPVLMVNMAIQSDTPVNANQPTMENENG